jgi:pimeloyl-ACP methyl ester carboxylesterase
MPTLDRDGTKLYYEEAGKGGPPFVFVHGWTCDHTFFAPQFDYYSERHRAVAVDLRGHGQSSKPEQDYTLDTFTDDIAWLCDQIGVSQLVVVGHSMGGAIALDLAARYPELVSAVVMVEAGISAMAPALRETVVGLVDGIKGPDHLDVRRKMIDAMMFVETTDPVLRARLSAHMLSAPQHVAASAIEQFLISWDGEAAARALKVPALHISAEQPLDDPAALRAANPLILTAQTAGAGHFNQLEVPEQVNAMIDRFLSINALSASA